MPPKDELSRKRAKRFHSALMTVVEEEGIPYMSTMTLDMLDARERTNLSNINQIFNPGPQHPPVNLDLVTPNTALRPMAPSPQANILITQQLSTPSEQGSAKSAHRSSPSGATPTVLNSDDDGDEDNSTRSIKSGSPVGAQRRARGRPRKDHSRPESAQSKGSRPWRGIRDLEAINLGQCLEKLLRDNASRQAGPFLAQCTLTYPTPTVQALTDTQVLAQLCLTLHHVSTVSCIDHVRWLFQALVAGDMIFARYGNLKGSRMIGKVKSEVQGAAVQSATSADGKTIDRMFTVARNVHFICSHFGTGSLFWLSSRFDVEFLNKNVSKDSRVFEETKANFLGRNFDVKIAKSGANQLGDAIRNHLQSVYNVHLDDFEGDVTLVDNSTIDGLNEGNGNNVQVESNDSTL